MHVRQIPIGSLLLLAVAWSLGSACGNSTVGGSAHTNTGQNCGVAADCYPGIDRATLQGEVECLSAVPGGYCTHRCATDTDCCAAPSECPQALGEVCAPFESTGLMQCFLTCENTEVTASGFMDSDAFCQRYTNAAFICRSSGGGSKNRKVCVPG